MLRLQMVDVCGVKKEDDEGMQETTEHEESDGLSQYGSRGPQFGGDSELLYSQFELISAERQMNQVVLLKVCILPLYLC